MSWSRMPVSPAAARALQESVLPARPEERPPDDYDRIRVSRAWNEYALELLLVTGAIVGTVVLLLVFWYAGAL